jgi:type VI protein secretion system component VasK
VDPCLSHRRYTERPVNVAVSALMALLAACLSSSAAEKDFTVELQARGPGHQDSVRANNSRSGATLALKTGESLNVQWSVLNPDKGGSVPDVTLHLSLNRTAKSDADTIYESALVMNFEPGSKGSAELLIQAPSAGDYVLKIETIGAAAKLGREYSAAIDVKIQ